MSSNLGLWHNATQTSGQIHRSAEARGRGEGAGRGAGRRCRQFRFWIRRPTARWRRSRSGLEARDVGLGLGRKEEEEGPMGRPQPMAAEEAASVSDLCVCVFGGGGVDGVYSSSFLSGLRSTMACSSSAVYLCGRGMKGRVSRSVRWYLG